MLICDLPLIWFCQHLEEVYCALCGSQLAFHMDISEGRGEILLYFGDIIFSTHPFWFIGHRKQAKGLLKGECLLYIQPPKFSVRYCLQWYCHIEFCIQWMRGLEATWMWVNIWHGVRREKQSMKTLEGFKICLTFCSRILGREFPLSILPLCESPFYEDTTTPFPRKMAPRTKEINMKQVNLERRVSLRP